jgi:tellurite resistance protein TehA-like permease
VSSDSELPRTEDINLRIQKLGQFSRFSRAGLAVIVLAFLIAALGRLPRNLESVGSAIDAVLLPLIFVGMGLLLYAIGMHLHLMHLNLVKQIRKDEDEDEEAGVPDE